MVNPVEKNSAIPLYYQVEQHLLNEIKNGQLLPGQALPTEQELCELYDISRPTLHRAVANLINRGVLYKEGRRGTYISAPKINADLIDNYEINLPNGEEAHNRIVVDTLEIVPADNILSEYLQIKPGSEVIFIIRRRYCNEYFLGFIRSYLRYPLCEHVMDITALEKHPLYSILDQKNETRIMRHSRIIRPEVATKQENVLFNKGEKVLINYLTCVVYGSDFTTPLSVDFVRFRGDMVSFRFDTDSNKPLIDHF